MKYAMTFPPTLKEHPGPPSPSARPPSPPARPHTTLSDQTPAAIPTQGVPTMGLSSTVTGLLLTKEPERTASDGPSEDDSDGMDTSEDEETQPSREIVLLRQPANPDDPAFRNSQTIVKTGYLLSPSDECSYCTYTRALAAGTTSPLKSGYSLPIYDGCYVLFAPNRRISCANMVALHRQTWWDGEAPDMEKYLGKEKAREVERKGGIMLTDEKCFRVGGYGKRYDAAMAERGILTKNVVAGNREREEMKKVKKAYQKRRAVNGVKRKSLDTRSDNQDEDDSDEDAWSDSDESGEEAPPPKKKAKVIPKSDDDDMSDASSLSYAGSDAGHNDIDTEDTVSEIWDPASTVSPAPKVRSSSQSEPITTPDTPGSDPTTGKSPRLSISINSETANILALLYTEIHRLQTILLDRDSQISSLQSTVCALTSTQADVTSPSADKLRSEMDKLKKERDEAVRVLEEEREKNRERERVLVKSAKMERERVDTLMDVNTKLRALIGGNMTPGGAGEAMNPKRAGKKRA